MIGMIWAQQKDKGIGYKNCIPWHVPEDLNHFKLVTLNKVIVMGYNTFLSLNKKPLPNRTNVVLTRKHGFVSNKENNDKLLFMSDVENVIKKFENQEIWIIGGKQIYDAFFNYADTLVISVVNKNEKCDTFLDYDLSNFTLVKTDKFNDFSVYTYVKNNLK